MHVVVFGQHPYALIYIREVIYLLTKTFTGIIKEVKMKTVEQTLTPFLGVYCKWSQ